MFNTYFLCYNATRNFNYKITDTKAEIFNDLNEREEILDRPDYLAKVQEIADWLKA